MATAGDMQSIVAIGFSLSLAYSILQAIDNFWIKGLFRRLKAFEAEAMIAKWNEDKLNRLNSARFKIRLIAAEVDLKSFDFFRVSVAHALMMAVFSAALVFFSSASVDTYVLVFSIVAAYAPPVIVPIGQYLQVHDLIVAGHRAIDQIKH